MKDYSRISLLETILMGSDCKSLGELSTLSKEQRNRIGSNIIQDVPLEAATLQDYNEALHYLLRVGPKETKEEARECLLAGLR